MGKYIITRTNDGWSARCRQHLNAGDNPRTVCCKTSLQDRSGDFPDHEIQLRVRQWCRMGEGIASDAAQATDFQ